MITCAFEDGNPAKLRHTTVDVIVTKDDKILLAKRSMKLTQGGKWGLAGGYMERDETIKQAAAREVHEETGWAIDNLRLLTIRDDPNRANEDRQNIVFVFIADAVEKTGEPDWESDEVKWFSLDELPPHEAIAFDHPDNIDLYKKYLAENLPLPVLG